MWSTSPNPKEREKREQLLPGNKILSPATYSIPADDKVWLINEADRRSIPVSWLATEIIKLGMETYKLMSDEVIDS